MEDSNPSSKTRIISIIANEDIYYPVVSFSGTHGENKETNDEVLCSTVFSACPDTKTDAEANTEIKAEKKTQLIDKQVVEETVPVKRSGFRFVISLLGNIAVGAMVVIALALVGVKIAGFKAFTVMSGSMEKSYPVGSLIYVKPVNYQSLQVGDVISYVANSDNTVVTHRIVDIEIDEEDPTIYRFKTKGDENNNPDAKLVHYKNVLGTPVITIPKLGYFAYNIQRPPVIYIILVAGTLLLAWTFLPGTLEERRKTARKSVA